MLTGAKTHGKRVSIVGAHFKSLWVKPSADTDRESLGEFGPAFVSDIFVVGHIQAGQACVHLQDIDQKDTVGGVLNGLKTIAQIMQKVKSKFVGNARV